VITAAEGQRARIRFDFAFLRLSVCLSVKRKSRIWREIGEKQWKTEKQDKAETNAIEAHKRQRTNQVAICGYERVLP